MIVWMKQKDLETGSVSCQPTGAGAVWWLEGRERQVEKLGPWPTCLSHAGAA